MRASCRRRCIPTSRRRWTSTRPKARTSTAISSASPRSTAARTTPPAWVLELHKGPDFLDRMLREKPGNVVIIREEQGKIHRIGRSVGASPARAGRQALDPDVVGPSTLRDRRWPTPTAGQVIAYDIMTERFEVTTILQRALVNDRGGLRPAVERHSGPPGRVHGERPPPDESGLRRSHIRPAWFFDTDEQGEGLNDIGTHLVDLVQWTLFPDQTHRLPHRREGALGATAGRP